MPAPLISAAEWSRRTSVIGFRSDEMKAIEEALRWYEQNPSQHHREVVQERLDAWKKKEGPNWIRSRRNKDGVVTQLTSMLAQGTTDHEIHTVPTGLLENTVNARLGVLYLFKSLKVDGEYFSVVLDGGLSVGSGIIEFAGAKISDGGLGNHDVSTFKPYYKPSTVVAKDLITASVKGVHDTHVDPNAHSVFEKIQHWLHDFAEKVINTLRKKFGSVNFIREFAFSLVKLGGTLILKALNHAALTTAFGSGVEMAQGVLKTGEAIYTRFKSWYMSRDVELSFGHPSTVVSSIHRAMTMSIFEGLYKTIKGASSIALAGLTAGASLIINLVVAITEMIIKLIWRKVEVCKMEKCFAEANELWDRRGDRDAPQKQPLTFATWYNDHVLNLPSLAILTLNSGICGDKLTWLSLYDSDRDIANETPEATVARFQSKYNAGVEFLDSLKVWGDKYLSSAGYKFSSSEAFVNNLLPGKRRGLKFGTRIEDPNQRKALFEKLGK
jgi:hypothetical protein